MFKGCSKDFQRVNSTLDVIDVAIHISLRLWLRLWSSAEYPCLAPWFCWKLSRSKRPGTTLMLGRLSNPTNLPPLHPEMKLTALSCWNCLELQLLVPNWFAVCILLKHTETKQSSASPAQWVPLQKRGYPMFSLGPSLQKPSTSPSCKKVKIPSDSRACVKSYGSLGPKERCCSRVSVQRGFFWGWPTKRDFLNVAVVEKTYESTLQS